MDAVSEEVTGLWDRSVITLTSVAGTNTITATATPALTASLTNDMLFILKPASTNTSTVTLNVNSGGAVAVVDAEGTALTAGALRANANYLIKYDSGFAKYSIVGYTPAAVVSSGLRFIKTQTASSSSSIDFVNGVSSVVFDATYDSYQIEISNAVPASPDVEFWLRVGTGGGPTYQTTSYLQAITGLTSGGATRSRSGQTDAIRLAADAGANGSVNDDAGNGVSATVYLDGPPTSSTAKFVRVSSAWRDNTGVTIVTQHGCGSWDSSTALTGIRFMFETGNIASGIFTL